MGSAPLAPGTTVPHQHCPCVQLWRHLLFVDHDPPHLARVFIENTYLLDEVRALKSRVRELEQKADVPGRR
jgi:hypothetical protein